MFTNKLSGVGQRKKTTITRRRQRVRPLDEPIAHQTFSLAGLLRVVTCSRRSDGRATPDRSGHGRRREEGGVSGEVNLDKSGREERVRGGRCPGSDLSVRDPTRRGANSVAPVPVGRRETNWKRTLVPLVLLVHPNFVLPEPSFGSSSDWYSPPSGVKDLNDWKKSVPTRVQQVLIQQLPVPHRTSP